MQYCRIARGSVEEILDDLNVCADEQYVDATMLDELKARGYTLIHKLNAYVAYLRKQDGNRE